MDSLFSFPVGFFHPLQHAGFDPGATKLDVAASIPVSRFIFNGLAVFYSSHFRWFPNGGRIPEIKRPMDNLSFTC
jgi:hypothetical protein